MTFSEQWGQARPHLLKAMIEDDEAFVVGQILTGKAQLWIGKGAALVTQISGDPLTIHAWLAGGDKAEILAMTPGIEAFGRTWGCKFATIEGRKGWQRVLRPMGYFGDQILTKGL